MKSYFQFSTFHVSAATGIFAALLAPPPRYNADMAEGYEEVEDTVSNGFLHSRCDAGKGDQERAAPGPVSLAGSALAGRQ